MSNNKQTQQEDNNIPLSNQSSLESLFHELWNTPKDKFTWYAILKKHLEKHEEELDVAYGNGYTAGEMDYRSKVKK